ncbi:transporter substrate-binding domain-containing protein [Pseudoduganella sp. FT26W]|uniref:Transporter substrate-binding domain-containing protein n=1 Tax=Duganella aquatilis TaxID=2666082 RepID=A0A844D7U5_9BURK|nr:transporter substrate-binding domain-containing protein [Duganella aquatilis]MRW86045.1 transporter substrate-binding domain-containing protein [Duganella aquatilis]
MRKTIFLLLALASAPVHAAERLAVGTTFSHIFEQGADGQWHGLGVDVLRTLAARAGDSVRFKLYPWPRALAMVERAQADILVGPYKSPERLKLFAFMDHPFYRDRMVFYARSDSNPPWQGDLAALKNRRIAAVRGWHYGAQFDQVRPLLDISEVPQLENGVQMLALGRVDLLATNQRNSTELIGGLHLERALTVLCPDITQLDGYLAFPRSPKFSAVRARYNALFTEMVRSGELARLGARNGVLVPSGDASARPSGACTDKRDKP